ncbi:MetQ/NlpA family ABC transporter substrate-binding protein [Metabacillus indicus]|uniref:MetQ/NlpA family ABC transporter substrate-binding protein n=1 Tax=Metabacillus indicus TaxID=246786 RepID=UPI003CEFC4A7
MKKMVLALLVAGAGILSACGAEETNGEKKEIKIGASAGPYTDMVELAIKPGLEKKGYEVEVVQFNDYIQPNNALGNDELDANLFQHKIYMETFAEQSKLKLSEIITVPTAPMGLYSDKVKDIDEVKEGASVAIPNDPTNAARALHILKDAGLIQLNEEVSPLQVSEKDVTENPKKLKFLPIEAAQLPRAVEDADLSAVPGNFALAAKMDLADAVTLENMNDVHRNRVVMNTKDAESEIAEDIIDVVESDEFEKAIDKDFKGFGKPEWMEGK